MSAPTATATCLLGTISLGALALALPAQASETIDLNTPVAVSPVTVVGTRTQRRVDDVPATVTVITADQIEANLVNDIKDLIKFEPGVSVPTSPARFSAALSGAGRDGNSGFTIRGMGGNRVLMIQDGVRVPDGFAFGAQAVGRGGYNDLDLVKSVEILRGPASALYGSDGIAGAVSFTTKDPSDFIASDRNIGARARVGYSSADEGWTEGLAVAGRSGSLSGMVAYTRRDSQQTENQGEIGGTGSSRTEPNPQDFLSNAAMAKLVWDANDTNSLRLTYDYYDSEMTGEALSSYSATISGLQARDTTDRQRLSAEWRNTGGLGLDNSSINVFWQQSDTRQWTNEIRTTLPSRIRDVTFDNTIWGLSAQGSKTLQAGAAQHRITAGADYTRTTQEAVRDGTQPPVGEAFPVRPFPKTEYDLAGVFLQDEIALLNGRLTLIPAVRYDWYELSPQADALFPTASEGQSESHVSPKIGAIFWANDHFGLFANYGAGFKAPSPMQVNNYFANPVYGYESIPNPDLKPETSTSIEAGMRFRNIAAFGGSLNLSATAFHSEYDDFIDQVVVSGTGIPGSDPLIYQYVNLTNVKIWGLEARGDIHWDNGFSAIVAASFADGEQDTDGTHAKLTSVDPIKLVGGLNYNAPSGRWGGQLSTTWSDKKSSYECGGGLCWPGETFTVVDLTAYLHLGEHATLRAGAFNLFDEKYAWWSDVRGLRRPSVDAAPAALDAYTQPGRNFGVSVSLKL